MGGRSPLARDRLAEAPPTRMAVGQTLRCAGRQRLRMPPSRRKWQAHATHNTHRLVRLPGIALALVAAVALLGTGWSQLRPAAPPPPAASGQFQARIPVAPLAAGGQRRTA